MAMRWSALEEMEQLRKQIDTIFMPSVIAHNNTENSKGAELTPPVEVIEGEDAYRVRFMLPGIDPSAVHLEATAKSLIISGELQPVSLNDQERVLLSQFRSGRFSKQLSFPDGIEHNQVEARYHHGILEVRVPKAAASQKKTVEIYVES